MTTVPRIVVLGDSLALSPAPDLNFTTELQARADGSSARARVRNASAWGDTTADGLRRLDDALEADTRILVVALGANDGLRGVPVAQVEANLDAIVARARQRNVTVLLCGMEAPPVRGWTYSLEFHQVFPRVAARHGVPLVPFLLAGVVLDPEMNGSDGLHPNAAGARRIADTVWPYLHPLIESARQAATRARTGDRELELSAAVREIPTGFRGIPAVS